MKAIYITKFGGPEVLELKKTAVPEIRSSEVLIEVHGASVNFADIKSRLGMYHGKGNPPFIPGLDVAGIVKAVGDKVEKVKVGDRVIAFPKNGSYAEFCVADVVVTYPIPEQISFDIAAACPVVAVTSYNLLANVANVIEGETVLIHSASGGIGMCSIQIAKSLGAKKVFATVGNDGKFPQVKQFGADEVFNYNDENLIEKVKEATDGHGVDVILDSMSGTVFEKSLEYLANFGRIVCFGNSIGEKATVITNDLHKTCRSVLGYSFGTELKLRPARLRDSVNKILNLIVEGKLKITISKKFKLEDAANAHRWIESRKNSGKVILIP